MSQQILFSSADQSEQTFENFFPAENQNVIEALHCFLNSDGFGCFYLYGQSGSGKTHLMNAISRSFEQVQYFDCEIGQLQQFVDSRSIESLAIDNFENENIEQPTLMLIYETFRQNSGKLFIASRLPPRALKLSLADLESRLSAAQVFELKLLNDQNKIDALRYRAGLRGFELSDEVLTYIINRYPRDFKTLFGLLDKLDDASLSNQRKLTVPFIKQLEPPC